MKKLILGKESLRVLTELQSQEIQGAFGPGNSRRNKADMYSYCINLCPQGMSVGCPQPQQNRTGLGNVEFICVYSQPICYETEFC